jgi:hypothetical protein
MEDEKKQFIRDVILGDAVVSSHMTQKWHQIWKQYPATHYDEFTAWSKSI